MFGWIEPLTYLQWAAEFVVLGAMLTLYTAAVSFFFRRLSLDWFRVLLPPINIEYRANPEFVLLNRTPQFSLDPVRNIFSEVSLSPQISAQFHARPAVVVVAGILAGGYIAIIETVALSTATLGAHLTYASLGYVPPIYDIYAVIIGICMVLTVPTYYRINRALHEVYLGWHTI